ncbi:unnamed protein product [Enterobius vermicularis]|uniref:VWFA domain-containing protein n=1 Tax=Enterobius vermicularis TaxID=51028 RepID=A0A0N4V5S1_ENTVE|nr:unnamed protein product [Enterobius vermicularis]
MCISSHSFFVAENEVWRDFLWTKSNLIKEAFVKNAATDKTLKTQYIATHSGLTRIYPQFAARKWVMKPESITVDLFDPRYRPWYIAAQSAPKDVLFLIDMCLTVSVNELSARCWSGSVKGQTIHLIRMTILHILTTLGPNDYMNAIWFNTKREFALQGCSDGFLPATTINKRVSRPVSVLREHLERLEERDQANLSPALKLGFKVFSEGKLDVSRFWDQSAGNTSGGHKLIMLFTDFDEEPPTAVFDDYDPKLPNNPIKIFGFSMGFGTGPLSVLNYLACRTNGGHFVVDSVSDVRHQAINYLTKLSGLLFSALFEKPVESRPVSWSNLMMDVQGRGPVLTLSMPILSPVRNNSRVVAVAAVDIELKQLIRMLPNNDQIYAFIVDNNGIVIYHPKLKLPKTELYAVRRMACHDRHSRQRGGSKIQFTQTDETVLKLMGLFDSIPTYDIKDLEPHSAALFEFRKAMIDRNCTEQPVLDDNREYFCSAVDGTPLVVGFVMSRKKTALFLNVTTKKPRKFESNLVGYFLTDQHICDGQLNEYDVAERFDALMSSNVCDDELNEINALVYASKEWIHSWPSLISNNSCAANPIPAGFDPFYFILSFIYTPAGFTSFYPNCSIKLMESALEEFKHRNFDNYQDENKLQLLPTFSKPPNIITYKNLYDAIHQKLLATVGVIWTSTFLTSYFKNLTVNLKAPNSSDWNVCYGSRRCHMVTETGHIVAGFNSEKHLAEADVFVLHELVKRSFAKRFIIFFMQSFRWTEIDSQAQCPPLRWMELLVLFKATIQDVQSQPVPLDDRCVYSETNHDELCTVEYPNYWIHINQTQYFYVNTGKCMRDVRIFPVPGVSLYLFVMQKPCENETVSDTLKKQYSSSAKRVPDCKSTVTFYRKRRSDFDYTRFDPKEPQTPCSSCIKLGIAHILAVIFFKTIFTYSFLGQ